MKIHFSIFPRGIRKQTLSRNSQFVMVYLRFWETEGPMWRHQVGQFSIKSAISKPPTLSNNTVIDCVLLHLWSLFYYNNTSLHHIHAVSKMIYQMLNTKYLCRAESTIETERRRRKIYYYIRTKNYAHTMLASFLLYLFPSYIFLRECSKKLTMFAMKRKKCLS